MRPNFVIEFAINQRSFLKAWQLNRLRFLWRQNDIPFPGWTVSLRRSGRICVRG